MPRNSYTGRRRAAAEPTIIDRLTAHFRGQAKPRGRHAAAPTQADAEIVEYATRLLRDDDTQDITLRREDAR